LGLFSQSLQILIAEHQGPFGRRNNVLLVLQGGQKMG
jgi:hypothetical protein